jgi:hypothetical protein
MDPGAVDRHLFDGDPDLTFHFDADRDPDHNPNFTHLRNFEQYIEISGKSIMFRVPFTFG